MDKKVFGKYFLSYDELKNKSVLVLTDKRMVQLNGHAEWIKVVYTPDRGLSALRICSRLSNLAKGAIVRINYKGKVKVNNKDIHDFDLFLIGFVPEPEKGFGVSQFLSELEKLLLEEAATSAAGGPTAVEQELF